MMMDGHGQRRCMKKVISCRRVHWHGRCTCTINSHARDGGKFHEMVKRVQRLLHFRNEYEFVECWVGTIMFLKWKKKRSTSLKFSHESSHRHRITWGGECISHIQMPVPPPIGLRAPTLAGPIPRHGQHIIFCFIAMYTLTKWKRAYMRWVACRHVWLWIFNVHDSKHIHSHYLFLQTVLPCRHVYLLQWLWARELSGYLCLFVLPGSTRHSSRHTYVHSFSFFPAEKDREPQVRARGIVRVKEWRERVRCICM